METWQSGDEYARGGAFKILAMLKTMRLPRIDRQDDTVMIP
jgi:hypothetical protein